MKERHNRILLVDDEPQDSGYASGYFGTTGICGGNSEGLRAGDGGISAVFARCGAVGCDAARWGRIYFM